MTTLLKGNKKLHNVQLEKKLKHSLFQDCPWKQSVSLILFLYILKSILPGYSASSNCVSHWETSLRWQLSQSSTWEMATEFTDFHPPLHSLIPHRFQRLLWMEDKCKGTGRDAWILRFLEASRAVSVGSIFFCVI